MITHLLMKRRICGILVASCLMLPVSAQSYEQYVERGMTQLQHDSLQDAEVSFRAAMSLEPARKSNAVLFHQIARIEESTGREQDALQSYTLAANMSPSSIDILLDRASLYLRLGNDGRAIADYSSVLIKDEKHAQALFFRAYLYAKKRDFRNARYDYDKLIKLDPTREDAIQGLALMNVKDGRPREAMEQMTNLIQLYPNHALNYIIRGGMEQERKNYELAIYDFNKAISLEPNNPEHLLSRANCYIAMRSKKLARRDLEAALRMGADKVLVRQLMKQL